MRYPSAKPRPARNACAPARGILSLLSDEADRVPAAVLGIDGGLSSSVMNRMPGRKWS